MSRSQKSKHKDPEEIFEVIQKMGEGNYGEVWKARNRETNQIVAVKIMPLETTSGRIPREIRKEIEFMRTLDHPNVIKYFGTYVKKDKLWIEMEFCGGGSLNDLFQATERGLEEDQIALICHDVLLGLNYLHTVQKKMHRDVKGGNILLTETGLVKLVDFGVSAELGNAAKRDTFTGTPYWMAPEVILGRPYDVRADVWSLGISALEMLEGSPPLSDLHPMRVLFLIPRSEPPRVPPTANVSRPMREFVAAALVKDASARPSAAELLSHPFVQNAPQHIARGRLVEAVRQAQAIRTNGVLSRTRPRPTTDEDSDDALLHNTDTEDSDEPTPPATAGASTKARWLLHTAAVAASNATAAGAKTGSSPGRAVDGNEAPPISNVKQKTNSGSHTSSLITPADGSSHGPTSPRHRNYSRGSMKHWLPSADVVAVTFSVELPEPLDAHSYVAVTGSVPALGEWLLPKRLTLEPTVELNSRPRYRIEVTVPQRCAFEYKYLLVHGVVAVWEEGVNRRVRLQNATMHGGLMLCDVFNSTVAPALPAFELDAVFGTAVGQKEAVVPLQSQAQTLFFRFVLLVPSSVVRSYVADMYLLMDRSCCGSWKIQKTQRMELAHGAASSLAVFVLVLPVPQTELPLLYKYAFTTTTTTGDPLIWEHGPNRVVRVEDGSQLVTVMCIQDVFRIL